MTLKHRSVDVELWLPAELRTRPSLAGVLIGRDYKAPRLPAISIQRTGGATDTLVDYPTLNINVWAATDLAANTLAATVATELQECRDHLPVLYVRPSGPTAIPSDVTGAVQRFMTAQAAVRREPT